jgi:hypothetical protein
VPQTESTTIGVAGWALDSDSGQAPEAIVIELRGDNGVLRYANTRPEPRPGVARTFGSPAYEMSGFYTAVSLEGVPAGTYRLNLISVGGDSVARCTTPRSLNV